MSLSNLIVYKNAWNDTKMLMKTLTEELNVLTDTPQKDRTIEQNTAIEDCRKQFIKLTEIRFSILIKARNNNVDLTLFEGE